MTIIGKDVVLKRLQHAMTILNGMVGSGVS
jgi:hypothetical protein